MADQLQRETEVSALLTNAQEMMSLKGRKLRIWQRNSSAISQRAALPTWENIDAPQIANAVSSKKEYWRDNAANGVGNRVL
jgi:hypothetical protein